MSSSVNFPGLIPDGGSCRVSEADLVRVVSEICSDLTDAGRQVVLAVVALSESEAALYITRAHGSIASHGKALSEYQARRRSHLQALVRVQALSDELLVAAATGVPVSPDEVGTGVAPLDLALLAARLLELGVK